MVPGVAKLLVLVSDGTGGSGRDVGVRMALAAATAAAGDWVLDPMLEEEDEVGDVTDMVRGRRTVRTGPDCGWTRRAPPPRDN